MNDFQPFLVNSTELCVKIKEMQTKLLELDRRLITINKKLERVYSDIVMAVLSETDSSGKPVYTNDLSRKTAIQLKAEANEEYCKLEQEKDKLERKIKRLKINLEFYNNMLKILLSSQKQ
jgi:hypothetical protein